jgi:PKD repeat protein
LIVSLAICFTLSADEDASVAIRLILEDRSRLEELSQLVSIDDVRGTEVFAEAFPEQLKSLRAAGFQWDLVEKAGDPKRAIMCPAGWPDDPNRPWECYPTYDQYVALMNRFATDYPGLCRLENLGQTTNQVQPHHLWILRISDNPDLEENEPEVLYTSTMHGDETTGYSLMLHLIDELLTGYGADPELTALVDDLEIWINPNANPDGTYFGGDTTVDGAIREFTTPSGTGSLVNPNRNFPDPDEGDHPDGNEWWLETQTMMALAVNHSFSLSANFHGGIEVVNYPWDTWIRRHVDDAWFIHISRAYADQAQAASPPGYMTALDNGITNGWDWYPIAGGRQDYMTYFHGGRELTIELSDTKLVPASQLDDHWNWNRQSLLDYLGQARYGIHGLVTDPGGQAIAATIEIVGHDTADDNSYVYTDPDVGDYHRLILPGNYTVQIIAAGYETAQFSGVTVPPDGSVTVDAVLNPLPTALVSGEVTTPVTRLVIEGATVEIVGTSYSTTTGPDGSYSLSGVFEGTHSFRVSADNFETIEVVRNVSAPDTVLNFALAPLSYQFFTDLEPDDGGLVSSQGWEWGSPTGTGNPGSHSGTKVWATNLAGDYLDNADWNLDLLGLTLSSDAPRLFFWHWYDIEQGSNDWDGGNLSLRPSGGAYQVVDPEGGYPSNDIHALNEPGFTGSSGGWVETRFDLSSWAGQAVDLRWHFASDGSVHELGWYLDDIAVLSIERVADFEFDPPAPGSGTPVQFIDRSSGPVESWWWDFDDGDTSSVQNPVHAFAAEGSYQVSLTGYFPNGQKTRIHPVTVGDPAAIFSDGFESGDMGAWSGMRQ